MGKSILYGLIIIKLYQIEFFLENTFTKIMIVFSLKNITQKNNIAKIISSLIIEVIKVIEMANSFRTTLKIRMTKILAWKKPKYLSVFDNTE